MPVKDSILSPPKNRVKVLSIREPEASWVFISDPAYRKAFENRNWATDYRGRLYIHASGKPPTQQPAALMPTGILPPWPDWNCGKILGSIELLACIPNKDNAGRLRLPDDVMQDIEQATDRLTDPDSLVLSEQVLSDIQFRDWQYFWVFADPILFDEPVPATGALRIWETSL